MLKLPYETSKAVATGCRASKIIDSAFIADSFPFPLFSSLRLPLPAVFTL